MDQKMIVSYDDLDGPEDYAGYSCTLRMTGSLHRLPVFRTDQPDLPVPERSFLTGLHMNKPGKWIRLSKRLCHTSNKKQPAFLPRCALKSSCWSRRPLLYCFDEFT